MNLLSRRLKTASIPYGVRVLTWATSVRWAGWGFGEPLLSIFMFSFAGTYAATGLLRSVYDIAFILALPVAGLAADRFRSTSLIIIGLIIYLFIGTGYFLAGAFGLVLLIVLVRFLNGISYALDVLGRDTYIRKHTPKEKLATVFGYFDTVADFWWIAAALAGTLLIKRFDIHELLFMIVPTSFIALLIVLRFRMKKEKAAPAARSENARLRGAYADMFRELGGWQWPLRLLALFNFFIAFGSAAVGFFLPIEAYTQGTDLSRTILISVALVVPTLFGWALGKWFDRRGAALFLYGFLAFGVLIGFLAFSDSYLLKLCVAFGVGVVLELLSVGSSELITVHANPEHFGRVGGIMRTIFDIGSMTGPLAIGILIDWQGAHISFFSLSMIMLLLAAVFHFMRKSAGLGKPTATAGAMPKHKAYHHKTHTRRNAGIGLP